MLEKCLEGNRFFDKGEGSQFPCASLEIAIGLSGKKEKRRVGFQPLSFDLQIESRGAGHPKVADHQVEI